MMKTRLTASISQKDARTMYSFIKRLLDKDVDHMSFRDCLPLFDALDRIEKAD